MKCPYLTTITISTIRGKPDIIEYEPENEAMEPTIVMGIASEIETQTETHTKCIEDECMAYDKVNKTCRYIKMT